MATASAALRPAHAGKQQASPGGMDGGAACDGAAASTAAPAPTAAAQLAAQLDAYSRPLLVRGEGAFKALLVAPLVVWWLAIGAGMWAYEGLPGGKRVEHVMLWFDRGLLRPAGPLVPFAVLALRAGVGLLAHAAAARHGGGARGPRAARPRLGSLLLWCAGVYCLMAVTRVVIYLTHYTLLARNYLADHVVSDHIFLAATMLICLHAEVLCLVSDMTHAAAASRAASAAPGTTGQLPQSAAEVLLVGLFVLAAFLYLFTAADMYYTAKYFHQPLESFVTAIAVFFIFQLPVLVWLRSAWRQRAAC